jgi:predicted ATPase
VNAPHYIETVGREGYRFLAPSTSTTSPVPSSRFQVSSSQTPDSALKTQHSILVGREEELTRLHAALGKALHGERQIVFVTGEPGIGKTTLVETFLAEVGAARRGRPAPGQLQGVAPPPSPLIGYGQCIEQYGGGEAYLPLLEAIGRLCREEDGQQVVTLLRRYAPTWLVQLSGVLEETEAQALRLQVQGATQQRMLREMAEALEQLTRQQPLLLVLEDLHWSDHATVELLSYLAQRKEPARLLILGAYRPADFVTKNHPLKAIKQELHAKRQCDELRVELLSRQDVSDYLTQRFPQNQFPLIFAEEIHRRTEGNALFMVNVVAELLQQGLIVEEQDHWMLTGDVTQVNVPDTLRQLIEKQIQQRTNDEQRLLEAASVAGTEFAVATVAAALKQDLDTAEETCEELAWQGHFLEERGLAEWPDGTVSGRYAFRHALYQNVLYGRIAEARRVRLHRQIGEQLETGYGSKAPEIAAELAMHFEQGRDYQCAVKYLEQAGKNATQRSAHQEAISLLTKGLALLQTLPDTPERMQQELMLQITLGPALTAIKGMAAPEVEYTYARARELCRQVGETPQLFLVLWGLFMFYGMRGELQTDQEVAEQLLRLAQSSQDPVFLALAHSACGATLSLQGALVLAHEHLEQGIAICDSQQDHTPALLTMIDYGVHCRYWAALVLGLLGYPDQAQQRVREALTLAREAAHDHSLGFAHLFACHIYRLRGEVEAVQEHAAAVVALATEQGLPDCLAMGWGQQGWARAQQGEGEAGIRQIRQGLTDLQATGARLNIPGLLETLAETCARVGQIEEGLSLVAEALALVDKTGERRFEARLYVLKGWLLLFSEGDPAEAEACFLKAIAISQKQQAKSLELRATTSLARLWSQQGKRHEARERLAAVYNWFTEGFETKDLQEAKALLDSLT